MSNPPGERTYALALAALAGIVLMVSVWYLSDPDGDGGLAYTVVSVALPVIAMCGPVIRRVRPIKLWGLLTLAGAFLTASSLDDFVTWRVGPFEYGDVTFLTVYALLIIWLVLLARIADQEQDRNAVLDTAAGCVGAVLAVWTMVLAPLSTLTELVTGAIWAAYPPLDVALIVLVLHLALRIGRTPPPLLWLLAGAVGWLIGDSFYAALEITSTISYDIPPLEAVFLVAKFCLTAAALHPRLGELVPDSSGRPLRGAHERKAAVVLLSVMPVILSTAFPTHGLGDTIVRTLLVTALTILVFVRLSSAISALADAEADSHMRATHDSLTGLLNRAALLDTIERRVACDPVEGRYTAVLFLDCDRFKYVNDTWGHHAGDTLLCGLAARLLEHLPEGQVLARHGGDEFVVVATVDSRAAAAELGEGICRAFDEPLTVLPGRTHPVTPSIGVAINEPHEHCSTDELLRRADAAMYAAKQLGRGRCVVFDDVLGESEQVSGVVDDGARSSFTG